MKDKPGLDRRNFLKQAAGAVGVAAQATHWSGPAEGQAPAPRAHAGEEPTPTHEKLAYPRQFRERQLRMISFPLGEWRAGSIGLGGRGQLGNWEIFNRPNQGFRPSYAFPAIWAQAGTASLWPTCLKRAFSRPMRVDGLGSNNAPGLSRLESAIFTGEYPLAHIDFEDHTLPVKVSLDAFSPFIPHEPDDSGCRLPFCAIASPTPARRQPKWALPSPSTTP